VPARQTHPTCNSGDSAHKLTKGETLDAAEKSHLANCEACMTQVIRLLDKSATGETHDLGTAKDKLVHARPEARKALEHGRQVFEREFGIKQQEHT
jgi:hypothetical protein